MPDNQELDNGSLGTFDSVSDEITSPYGGGTAQAQAVKLLSGTANAADPIPGDTANGLDVDVTRVQGTVAVTDGGGSLTVDGSVAFSGSLPAGSNNIGDVDVVSLPAPLNVVGGGVQATALRVTVASDTTGVLSVDDNGASLTVDGTVTANLAAGSNNIGDVDVLSVVPGTGATSLGKAEDAVHASGDTGVYALGVRDSIPAAHSGADGDYESLHVSDEGGLWSTELASSQGGTSVFKSLDLDETEEEVKGTAASLYGWWITNTTSATLFVKFYNATAANVTVGTTVPVMTLAIPGNATDDVAANMAFAPGIRFDTALTVACTTGAADNDSGAPAAGALIINVFYK